MEKREGQGVRAVWGEGERDGPKLKLRRGGRREAWKDGREGKNRTETKA